MTTKYLTYRQAASYLGLSADMLYRLVPAGKGPRPCRIAPRTIRFDTEELDRWMRHQQEHGLV